jgi:hypothetical protein
MILRVYFKPDGPHDMVMQVYVGEEGTAATDLIRAGSLRMPSNLFFDLYSGNTQPEFFDARNMGGPPE